MIRVNLKMCADWRRKSLLGQRTGHNDALGGGAGDDRITGSIHKRVHWRSVKHYKNRSFSSYFLLGWRHKRHVKRDCQSALPGYVHTHNMHVSGLPRQSEVRV
jgi:hypothetical protein